MTAPKVIYELRAGDPEGDPRKRPAPVHAHGTYADKDEAQAALDRLRDRIENQMPSPEKPPRNKAYWLHEIRPAEHWPMPSEPMPRDRYSQRWAEKETRPGCWNKAQVDIHDNRKMATDLMPCGMAIASYERDYPGTPPFEPFRQGGRDYALISEHYTATAVMDLQTGKVVAAEKPASHGFCPVGFYVPDWRDVHDGSIVPGSLYWEKADEWPDGTLGFVWGCVWGDDNGWKAQALDLSQIGKGKVARDERFGYLYLDTTAKDPKDFIKVLQGEGATGPRVIFSVPRCYDIATGKNLDGDL